MHAARRPLLALSLLFALGATWSGCDTAPGPPEYTARPALTAVSISPTEDSLATSAAVASVPLVISGDLAGDGSIRVRTLVRYAETDTLVADFSSNAGPGRFEQQIPLSLPRGATGAYQITVSTEGADGRAGDEASAVFHFKAASLGPPSLTVAAASSVTRVAGREVRFPIVATVTDPDGRANIAAVYLQFPDGGGFIGQLFDEGATTRSTDQRANDGRYTAELRIGPNFAVGSYTLEVIAVDRAGMESAPVPFTFTVQ